MAARSIQPHWSDDRELVVSVARHANEASLLTSVSELLDFFDEPWHYDEIHESYLAEQREDTWRENQITRHLDSIAGVL